MRRRTRARSALSAVVAVAVLAVLVGGLWNAWRPRAESTAERVREVAAGLGCPACAGQSVADSQAASARAMRAEIAAQLRAGRSPDQIRAWFAERYGDRVLLAPPLSGLGLLAWGLPVAAFACGTATLIVLRRRSLSAGDDR